MNLPTSSLRRLLSPDSDINLAVQFVDLSGVLG